ncbi:MAG: hypothetical protein EBQ92_01115 [Proteobacteria bacterium]|nr:hypothetical protein [Pseudomonadota bacterium]
MLNIAAPIIGGIFDLLKGDSKQIAKNSGLEEGVVGKVLGAVEAYATRDERLQAMLAAEIDKARQHDVTTFDKNDLFSNRLRSSVRPLITFAAMAWYIYARLTGIPLAGEDYAIIGGVMMFWFGFRPFEKRYNP